MNFVSLTNKLSLYS